MIKVIVILLVALVVLHQDFWFWEDSTLVAGIFPIGLVWHVGISIGAAAIWSLAAIYCWPADRPDTMSNGHRPPEPGAGSGSAGTDRDRAAGTEETNA